MKFKKWKHLIFSMGSLVSELSVGLGNCRLRLLKHFSLPTWGCQNISKEILLTFLKICEKTPSSSGDIKNFRSKMRRVNPNFRKYRNSRKPGNVILSVGNYCTLTLVISV